VSWPPTEEERLLRDTTREFAQREVAPEAAERDEAELFDRAIFRRMGELGLTAAPIPESAGGGGFSYLGWTLAMEELGAVDMASAVTLSVHVLAQLPVVTWGSDAQISRWLPDMLSGEALGAFAQTKPHAPRRLGRTFPAPARPLHPGPRPARPLHPGPRPGRGPISYHMPRTCDRTLVSRPGFVPRGPRAYTGHARSEPPHPRPAV
jgi:hypothetical protein